MFINIHKNYKGEYRSGRFGKRTCYFLLSFYFPLFSLSTLSLWRKEHQLNMFKIPLVLRPLPCTLVVDLQVMITTALIWDDRWLNCLIIACGKTGSGFTAAMNQLAFGAPPGLGPGDACGRCFSLTGTADPFSPAFTGPFHSIVVKVTNLW